MNYHKGRRGFSPDKQRVLRQGNKRLANGGRDGAHKQEARHDQGPHVLGCLGERILQSSDTRQDLRDGDQDI